MALVSTELRERLDEPNWFTLHASGSTVAVSRVVMDALVEVFEAAEVFDHSALEKAVWRAQEIIEAELRPSQSR